ncbi:hypothetical protein [Rubripirellula obstinata]|uniref:hypothetical protein n=1 Tax=Rubripirellula obstinata TaxID=406547 RepID=UPI00138FF8C3|nr:hypothetical protein [Rubripirellula obstinata]
MLQHCRFYPQLDLKVRPGKRITIACTGVAAARFSLCLHVKSRHLGDAYRYPTEPRTFAARLAPCGA